jgi:hypothetical protein
MINIFVNFSHSSICPSLNEIQLYLTIFTCKFKNNFCVLFFQDYVYVFDGIPSFASPDPSQWAPLLAAYCGYHRAQEQRVEATSGYLTVFYEANMEPC